VRLGTFRIRCQQYVARTNFSALSLGVCNAARIGSAKYAQRFPQYKHSSFSRRSLRSLTLRRKRCATRPAYPPPRAPCGFYKHTDTPPVSVTPGTYKARGAVFQQLMEFFPQEAKKPAVELAEVTDQVDIREMLCSALANQATSLGL
jgi:hypothetical protein